MSKAIRCDSRLNTPLTRSMESSNHRSTFCLALASFDSCCPTYSSIFRSNALRVWLTSGLMTLKAATPRLRLVKGSLPRGASLLLSRSSISSLRLLASSRAVSISGLSSGYFNENSSAFVLRAANVFFVNAVPASVDAALRANSMRRLSSVITACWGVMFLSFSRSSRIFKSPCWINDDSVPAVSVISKSARENCWEGI